MSQRLRLALLGLWLGAMVFFTTAVAQAAFAVLPTRRMAGDLVAPVLANLEYTGLVMSVVLLLLLLLAREVRRKVWFVELGIYLATLLTTFIARFIVAAKIHNLRAQFGDQLDTLTATDPAKILFGQLHGISIGLTGLDIILVLVVIVMLILQSRNATKL